MTKRPAREGAPARIARSLARDPLLARLGDDARSKGWRVELVGGWVRDAIGRREARDVDLATADPEPLLAWLAERSAHRGVTFEQRVVNHRFTIDGRTVDVVERAERTVEEELARRDFTVNAMAIDLASGRFLDPCGGLADLDAGRLRLPRPDAFEADPIRVFPFLAIDEECQ